MSTPERKRKRKSEPSSWLVRYRATIEGTTVVDAESAEEARAKVVQGDFDFDSGQEMVDWEARGDAEPNE